MVKVLGAIAVLAALAAGCGSSDEQEPSAAATPVATPAEATSPEPAAETGHGFAKGHSRAVRKFYGDVHSAEGNVEAEYHQPPQPATGGIGDTITLTGSNIGVRFDVTVTRLVDPATTARRPREGKRYVGVDLAMQSTGITNLEDDLNAGLLRYGARGRARAVLGVKAGCSNGFQRLVFIEVGLGARGCVLFEIPASARPRQFQFALEQVPAEAGGRWRLR